MKVPTFLFLLYNFILLQIGVRTLANYCIGDLHGREDLFFQLIEKIDFNPECDKLYILGDVIDGGYGGIRIIKYLQSQGDSCFLLKGNHEERFLCMKKAYDTFMLNPELKEGMKSILEVYSENLYEKIEEEFLVQVEKKGSAAVETVKIKKWIEEGDERVRKTLLLCIVNFMEVIEYNHSIYEEARLIWRNLRGHFDTKNFVRELFEQTDEEYKLVVDYIESAPRKLSLRIGEKDIVLFHSIRQINEKRIFTHNIMFPHAETQDVTYVFGHEPIPKIHKYISQADGYCGFSFDFRRVFAYCDEKNNRYYNLDLGSNPIVALCLDNMNEYYVGLPSHRKNASEWMVPTDKIERAESQEVKTLEYANFYDGNKHKKITIENGAKKDCAYVTYKEGCYDYLMGIQFSKKRILYTRVDLIDYHPAFVIDGWYCGQTIGEILQKVKEDFALRLESKELDDVYEILYGMELNKS